MTPFDASGAFLPSVRTDQVRRLAIRGAGVTLFSGGSALAAQIVATVILARLLTPADFGVVTMVTTFSLLLLNFGQNGFTEAVIQRDKIDRYLISNLFWINLGTGLLLAVGFAGAGSLLARFYHNPQVAPVAVGISVAIFITSTSVQHIALLKRAMHFSSTSANDVISRILSLTVSIVLAWMGWGYWALVAGVVAQPLSQSVGAWFLCRWTPSLPRRVAGTASMVKFAVHIYSRFSVNYFARNTDNLLVGWRFGANALGFYKKAYDLFALSAGQLTAPLTNVAVSALSRFNPRSSQYRQFMLESLSVMAFVGMGLSAEFTLVGTDLIRLLLGKGWEPAGRIFTFFGPGIGVMLIYYTHGWIHLSIGKADRWLRWGLIEVSVTCLFFVLALPWGPAGIAVAWTASFWVLTIPSLWYAGRPIDFRIGPVISAVWQYVLAGLLAGSMAAAISQEIRFLRVGSDSVFGTAVRVAGVTVLLGILYLGAVTALYRGFTPLYQVARLLREMITHVEPLGAPPVDAWLPGGGPRETPVPKDDQLKPLVSVLIPAFNAEESIAETLRSVVAQTWERKEIIVVDDGSSDQTVAVARQFEAYSVRVFTQANQGAAAARNKAFSLSRGDYIQWLDADDVLAPDKIEKQMELLDGSKSKRTLLSSAYGRFQYRTYRTVFIPTALWCDLSPVEWLTRKMGQNSFMQTATWLVSRELSEAAGGWDTNLLADDDGEYFSRVLLASDGVHFVPESKVYYRSPRINTLSYLGASGAKLDAHWRSMRLQIRYVRSLEESDRVRDACIKYLQSCVIYFYPERPDILNEIEEVARELGRPLGPPRLPLKYSWIPTVFGWKFAKRVQLVLLGSKWWLQGVWDKTIYLIETPRQRGPSLITESVEKAAPPIPSVLKL